MSIKNLTTYHPNGQKKAEGNWDGFEPVGDHICWFENGNKEYESIEPDEFIMKTTSWFENGQMMSKGSLSQSNYCEIGLWTHWYENGNKKSEGRFKGDDGRDGEWNFWSSNGQLICSGIHKGWRGDGMWTFWDETGTKVHEREYKNAELLGVWKNLRECGCSDDLIDTYKQHIFK